MEEGGIYKKNVQNATTRIRPPEGGYRDNFLTVAYARLRTWLAGDMFSMITAVKYRRA